MSCDESDTARVAMKKVRVVEVHFWPSGPRCPSTFETAKAMAGESFDELI